MFGKSSYDYDIVVIGAGGAGLTAAKFARGLNKKVALIESERIGGECTWTGCVPSKTLIHAAQIAYHAAQGKNIGISSSTIIDSTIILQHIRSVITEIYAESTPEKIAALGIKFIKGFPEFETAHSIILNGKKLSARKFIIATGSHPLIPDIKAITQVDYLTNQNFFNLKKLPSSLLIIGGGAIGTELACALTRLNVKVTIIEKSAHLLSKEDPELISLLQQQMVKENITINTQAELISITQEDSSVSVSYKNKSGTLESCNAEKILIAVGRKPNIETLNLEKAFIKYDSKGITVNQYLQTSQKNIYACGDVVGPYQFSHMAGYQATIAARNALIPFFKEKVNYDNRLWVTFTSPELATLGLTHAQATQLYGDSIMAYNKQYTQLDRAHTDGTTHGNIKVICTNKGMILGATILGERAGELIHELQLAKNKQLSFYALYSIIHAYPTYSEIIGNLSKESYIKKLQHNFFLKIGKKILNFLW